MGINLVLKYRDEEKTLSQWCSSLNLKASRVRERLRTGWSIEDAFEKPITNIVGVDYVGQKFNRMTVIEMVVRIGVGARCLAKCDCGVIKEIPISSLKSGGVKSCGCLRTENNSMMKTRLTHGLSNHPLHEVWSNIKDRCYCVTDNAYPNYGGKGVKMCKEWRADFKVFFDWCMANGWAKGLQIDKDKLSPYKTGKMYSPKYCCFLTRSENMKYRSNAIVIKHNNTTKMVSEWAKIYGLNERLIRERYRKGWSAERILETPRMTKYLHVN